MVGRGERDANLELRSAMHQVGVQWDHWRHPDKRKPGRFGRIFDICYLQPVCTERAAISER